MAEESVIVALLSNLPWISRKLASQQLAAGPWCSLDEYAPLPTLDPQILDASGVGQTPTRSRPSCLDAIALGPESPDYSAARLLCACSHSKTVLLVDSRPWGRGLLDGLRLGIPRCPKCLGNGGSEEALRWTSPINRRPVEASEAAPTPCSGGLVTEVTGRSTWPGWVKSSAAVAVTFWDVLVGSRRLLGSALALGTLGSALALGASHKGGSSTDVWLIKGHCQNSMKFATSIQVDLSTIQTFPPLHFPTQILFKPQREQWSHPIHQHEPRTSGSLVGGAYRLRHLWRFGFGARRVNLSWKRLDSVWTPGNASRWEGPLMLHQTLELKRF